MEHYIEEVVPDFYGKWESIATAPKDGDEILLFAKGDIGLCYWREDNFDGRGAGWTWGLEKRFINPSHWMPLPNHPNK